MQTIKTTRFLEIERHDVAKSLAKCTLKKNSVSTVYSVQVWFIFYYLFEKRLKFAFNIAKNNNRKKIEQTKNKEKLKSTHTTV